jgi:MATE family multidrug resistance protein
MFSYQRYKKDFRLNLKLGFPIMLGQLGQVMVNLADNLMVGQLGADALAAVSFANAIFVIFIVLGMGLSFALPPLISEADGANDFSEVPSYFKHSLLINSTFALFTLGILYLSIPLLDDLGQAEEIIPLAKDYLILSAWSTLPFMVFLTLRAYSEGMSFTVPPMTAMLLGNIINIALNYALIFGHWSMPVLGVEGAALASLIARVCMAVLLFGLLFRKPSLWIHLVKTKAVSYSTQLMEKLLKLGIPTSLQMFFEVSAFSAAAVIAGMVSKEVQAAHQIAISLASVTFLICTGLAMASTVRVGNQLGKKDYPAMRRAGFSAIIQVTLMMACCSVLFIVLKDILPQFYIKDADVIKIAAGLLIYAAIFQIPDGIQVTALSSLRGMKDVKVPTVITLISYYIIGIPMSYICAISLGWGGPGVWLGLVVGLSISATLLSLRFARLSKKALINS